MTKSKNLIKLCRNLILLSLEKPNLDPVMQKQRSITKDNLLAQINHLLEIQKMSMFRSIQPQQMEYYRGIRKGSSNNTSILSNAETQSMQTKKLNLLQTFSGMIIQSKKQTDSQFAAKDQYLVNKHREAIRKYRTELIQPLVEEQKSQSGSWFKQNQAQPTILTKEEISLAREYFNRLITLRALPLWITDQELHEKEFDANHVDGTNDWSFCCYNHAIGLPKKFGLYFPLHDYEVALLRLQLIENHRRIALLKSRGLGGTELALRKMSWLCLYNDLFNFTQMALVTGTRLEFAVDLMTRLKGLFLPRMNIIFPYADTVCYLNKVRLKSYPAHKLHPLRGQPNMSYILADEADFYLPNLQQELMDILIGYIVKGDLLIDLISTPNLPYGLFYTIEHQKKKERIFTFVKYDYHVGLGKIYRQREIDFVFRTAPDTAARELELRYGYATGRLFSEYVIEMIKKFGEIYKPPNGVYHPPLVSRYTKKVLIGDPAYGKSSKFGTLILELLSEENCIRVVHAETESMSDDDYMKNKMLNLYNEFNPENIYIDAHWSGFIRALRKQLGDPTDPFIVDQIEKECAKTKSPLEDQFIVNGIAFSNRTREMASYAKSFIDVEGYFACDPVFSNLLGDMANAELKQGKLVKTDENPRDLVDCLLMGLGYFR